MYYFAYGSNLNIKQMKFRCPKAVPLKAIDLPGWRLEFREGSSGSGVANIREEEGSCVTGVLWNVSISCLASLDRYEGYPYAYTYEYVPLRLAGRRIWALTYIHAKERLLQRPSKEYYGKIADGYETFNIGFKPLMDALDEAIEHGIEPYVFQKKEPTRRKKKSRVSL